MMEVLAAIFGGIAFVFLVTHTLCFYYLEISNSYDRTPYLKFNFELLTYYDKKIKKGDEIIKKICNITLVVGGIGFALGVIFMTVLNFI
jgi:hypothetical protein